MPSNLRPLDHALQPPSCRCAGDCKSWRCVGVKLPLRLPVPDTTLCCQDRGCRPENDRTWRASLLFCQCYKVEAIGRRIGFFQHLKSVPVGVIVCGGLLCDVTSVTVGEIR